MHGSKPPMHHRFARTHRHFPERQIEPFGGQGPLYEVMVTDRGAAGCDKDIAAEIARATYSSDGFRETIRRNAEGP